MSARAITKALLVLTIIGLGSGFVISTDLIKVPSAAFYVALPGGAIFLGLFLISRLLEKESDVYDAEQKANLQAAERAGAGGVGHEEEARASGASASKSPHSLVHSPSH